MVSNVARQSIQLTVVDALKKRIYEPEQARRCVLDHLVDLIPTYLIAFLIHFLKTMAAAVCTP